VKTVVVDDGSSDDTGGVARAEGAIVVRHRVNLGKGGALLTGCEAAERLGADIIVTMDADGQHRPEDVPRLLAPILAGATDMVVGVRALAGEMPGIQRAGNHALNLCIKGLFGVSISDTQCGFRAFRTACYPKLRWRSRGYAVESEMLVRMVRAGLPWEEISIGTIYHDRYKGTQPADGLRILYQMVLWRLGV
jgi:glycosyltransferase involved in cell wall biosynthesis